MQEQKETTGNNTEVKYAEVKYTKAQIKQANLFPETNNTAIINIALEDNRTYTIAEIKKAIEEFKGGM
ncbi:hypothetical protein P5719_001455 [Lactobacillus amylovorus]|uniref:hypothetical protein n=1 Tax=Lactobacillus amylovorus TaxID=1604 RepID=UPI00313CE09C|nr:hypothetical protein [Lactobacillus amylovorus]